jgi:hypothetical protein
VALGRCRVWQCVEGRASATASGMSRASRIKAFSSWTSFHRAGGCSRSIWGNRRVFPSIGGRRFYKGAYRGLGLPCWVVRAHGINGSHQSVTAYSDDAARVFES